jgi:chromosome segregation ATPase
MTNAISKIPPWLGKVLPPLAPIVVLVVAWSNMSGSIGEVRGELQGLKQYFADFRESVKELKERLNEFDKALRQFQNQLEQFSDAVNKYESVLGELRSEHRRLETRFSELQKIIAPPGSEPIPVGFYLEVTTRLRRMEERLDAIAEKVGVPRGSFKK